MREIYLMFFFCFYGLFCPAQKKIRDKHITFQQERMVFKQWDADKFTPKPGFLGLNPEYWITWALHPNYPKTDLRPLGPVGPQTQRLMFAAAMQQTDNLYKLHADTLRNTALSEASNYSSALSFADPLWLLYYRNEFEALLSQQDSDLLFGLSPAEQAYLSASGLLDWYKEECHALLERLEIARSTTVDRGSRIMAYHRMLGEFRKLSATWEAKKANAKLYLSLKQSAEKIRSRDMDVGRKGKSDAEIADDILKKSKL